MQSKQKKLKALIQRAVQRARDRAVILTLTPMVALMSRPAFADLPVIDAPGDAIGGGTVAAGDWLGSMGAWFKAGLTIFLLVVTALGFGYAAMGAIGRWRNYSMGRIEMSDFLEYAILAAVLGVFLVVMATYGISTLD